MCIIFLAYGVHPQYPLLLIANRDEFYSRPSAPAGYWGDDPQIFAGRDLIGGGAWLGYSLSGRFAAVTNFRGPGQEAGTISRGALVADFLASEDPAASYLGGVLARQHDFSGFNLIAGEINSLRNELYYFSNRDTEIRKLDPGIYGLSNHLLDTPWPKVERGKRIFSGLVEKGISESGPFFEMLSDKTIAADAFLPETGVGIERERLLSPIFIEAPGYGTRCSSILRCGSGLKFELIEKVYV